MKFVILCCALGFLFVLGAAQPARAVAIVDAEYTGVTTDLADFKIVITGLGAVTGLEVGTPTASVPQPCFDSGMITLTDTLEILNNTINRGQAERQFTDPASGELRVLRLSGRVLTSGSEDGIATGEASISAYGANSDGIVCNPRSFGWAAVASARDEAPLPQTVYRGPLTAGQSMGGLREGGTASFSVTADASAITRLTLTPTQECAATDLGALTAALTAGRASFSEEGKVSTAIPVVGKYRVTVAGGRALGAFYIDRGKPGCLPLGGFFVATPVSAPSAAPTPTLNPPSAAGSIISGAIPLQGGIGLIVWGGGGSDQLLTLSGCPRASAAFWVSNASGGFDAYVPGASVAVVNVTWSARFVGGIPPGTALLGRCV